MSSADRNAFLWVVHHRVSWLNPVFEAITYLATGGWIWLLIAALLAWRARRDLLNPVLLTAATVWIADAVAALVKILVARQRPFLTLHGIHVLIGHPGSNALPSSHATTAFAGATFLAYRHPRSAVPVFLAALAIAFSRVYVGVHYPGDVIAGALIGIAVALLVVTATRLTPLERWVADFALRLRGLMRPAWRRRA